MRDPIIGESGIRTHGTVSGSAVFKTAALNRSAISPDWSYLIPFGVSRRPILDQPRMPASGHLYVSSGDGETLRPARRRACRGRSPAWGVTPEATPNAIAGGSATNPTVMPAMMSERKVAAR